jgi:hypothetical protein
MSLLLIFKCWSWFKISTFCSSSLCNFKIRMCFTLTPKTNLRSILVIISYKLLLGCDNCLCSYHNSNPQIIRFISNEFSVHGWQKHTKTFYKQMNQNNENTCDVEVLSIVLVVYTVNYNYQIKCNPAKQL